MRQTTKRAMTAAVGVMTLTTSIVGSGVGLALADDHENEPGENSHENEPGDEGDDCGIESISHEFAAAIAADPAVAKAWAAYNAARAAARHSKAKESHARGRKARALRTSGAADDVRADRSLRAARHQHKRADAAVKAARQALQRARAAAIARITAEVCGDTPTPTPTVTPSPTLSPPVPVTPPAPSPVINGTFLGAASKKNPYGTVQVQIVVTKSKITSVTAPKYPTSSDSGRINARAIPILVKETLVAQSAAIASVSGASYTSPAFKESLQSAIAKSGI